ncbi:hypothetical protein ACQEU5_24780 [Marinactinospora thermotolerans]|uniref:hypothetical protein n=1 Tax=Marinactinospora thermotolerans TaxID=531310 RepID=UPI003D89C090
MNTTTLHRLFGVVPTVEADRLRQELAALRHELEVRDREIAALHLKNRGLRHDLQVAERDIDSQAYRILRQQDEVEGLRVALAAARSEAEATG